jgi:histone-arginine methyltransferase CARM1
MIPFQWQSSRTGVIHGIGGWFDIVFNPPGGTAVEMSTGPHTDITHWYQTRFLFSNPLPIKQHQLINGWMRCIANNYRSYTIYIEVVIGPQDQLSDPTIDDMSLFLSQQLQQQSDKNRRRGKWELQEQTYSY